MRIGAPVRTALGDSALHEKIFRFDHERTPERVTHTRDFGVRGLFECSRTMLEKFFTQRLDGALLSPGLKEALWHRVITAAPRPRLPSELHFDALTHRPRDRAGHSAVRRIGKRIVFPTNPKRTTVEAMKTGPTDPRSTVLTGWPSGATYCWH
nr:catalase [Cereibacter ovatus]